MEHAVPDAAARADDPAAALTSAAPAAPGDEDRVAEQPDGRVHIEETRIEESTRGCVTDASLPQGKVKEPLVTSPRPAVAPTVPVKGLDATDLKSITSLTNKQRAFLTRGGFNTTAEVLFTPIKDLSERLKLSDSECQTLIQAIVNDRKQRWTGGLFGQSVRARLETGTGTSEHVSSIAADPSAPGSVQILVPGDESLAILTGGGLSPGTLTEITGEASSGKTALALQLSLRVQLPRAEGGLAGSCAYLSSEGNFPSTRLRDMAFTMSDGSADGIKAFMDNVHLIHCPEVDELLHVMRYNLPGMVEQSQSARPVKLVIVDSIAAPFRGIEGGSTKASTEDGSSGLPGLAVRNNHLCEIASRLHKLAQQFQLVVVINNQVTDVFIKLETGNLGFNGPSSSYQAPGSDGIAGPSSSVTHENGGVSQSFRNYKHASRFFSGEAADPRNSKAAVFGLMWSNCINSRIMLSRTGRRKRKLDGTDVVARAAVDEDGYHFEDALFTLETEEVRRATLVFSPSAELGHVDYVLRQEGLKSVGPHHETPRGPGTKRRRQKRPISGKDKHRAAAESRHGDEDEDDDEDALWAEVSGTAGDEQIDEATLSQL